MTPVKRTDAPREGWLQISVGVAVVAMAVVGLVAWRLEVSSAGRAAAERDRESPMALDSNQATSRVAPASAGKPAPAANVVDLSLLGEDGLATEREGDAGVDAGSPLEDSQEEGADRSAFPLTAEEVAFVPGQAPARARDTGLVFSAPADPAFDPAVHKPDEVTSEATKAGEIHSSAQAEQPEIGSDTHGIQRDQPAIVDEPPPVRRKDLDTGLVFTAPGEEPDAK